MFADLKSYLFKGMMNTSHGEEKQKTNDSQVKKRTENDKSHDTLGRTREKGRK